MGRPTQRPSAAVHPATVFLEEHGEFSRLRDGQGTIAQTFRVHLKPLVYEVGDDYPAAYDVPGLPGVQIHPMFNAGRMSFRRNRIPLFAVAGLRAAGESPATVRQEFGLDGEEVQLVGAHMDWLGQAAEEYRRTGRPLRPADCCRFDQQGR